LRVINWLDVFDTIRKRRSIRRFKTTPISQEQIERLLDAARLAPSGCNVQPWRFIIVEKRELKTELCKASFDQKIIESAAVVVACCGDLLSWKKTMSQTQELLNRGDTDLNEECKKALMQRVDNAVSAEIHERIASTLPSPSQGQTHLKLKRFANPLNLFEVRTELGNPLERKNLRNQIETLSTKKGPKQTPNTERSW